MGKPEPLKHVLSEYWSRQINEDSLFIASTSLPLLTGRIGSPKRVSALGGQLQRLVGCYWDSLCEMSRLRLTPDSAASFANCR
ncbi:type II toxin-antitoxin system YoeB family toxin [Nitrosococcus watsonii]|uniref:type II toxin-antitoxin system YoeB family toxin n=1 Tax=Nitrosococcus watsonii TaxID=473531 RepID=UPI001E555BF5|nr:type II toxin-antitoxin system YoeB family toxin [Nitrosococcus watsonii]